MLRAFTIALLITAVAGAEASTWTASSPPPDPGGKFRRKRSRLNAKLGRNHHSAVDVVTAPGAGVTIEGKFAYGKLSKDLEHEDVTLYLERGKTWVRVTRARTNDDGRALFRVPGRHLRVPGPHRAALVVHGDKTTAYSTIWVLSKGTRTVLFDIDGTLTTGDSELVENTLIGDKIDMRRDANALAKHWAKRGLTPVYLTGRPYMYNVSTRQWLAKHGFPHGPLVTVKFVGQGSPSSGGVGRFKRRWVASLLKRGLVVVAAYGNAKTDVCAFAEAGVAPTATFIVGKHGGKACENDKRKYPATRKVVTFGAHLRVLVGPAK